MICSRVVNEWLPCASVDLRGPALRFTVYAPFVAAILYRIQTICCSKSSLAAHLECGQLNLFDCATARSFGGLAGAQRICAMIETVTAVMGLVSVGIFLAHAFEGYRSRA